MPRAAVLSGLGAWVPPGTLTNEKLAAELDTSDEWIRTRTGIGRRHIISAGMCTSDLAVEAGRRALESAGAATVDYLLLATTTPDRLCPATGPEVATRLGLGTIPAFDLSAVCSGFLYGLQTGRALVLAGLAESVLVVGAESFSTLVDPEDRNTRPIFGDGAGAVVLRAGHSDEPGALRAVNVHSDGSLAELITVAGGGARARAAGDDRPAHIRMRGRSTFMAAVSHMEAVTRQTVDEVGWQLADVDRVVGHQANVRILHSLVKHLGLPESAAIVHLHAVGNTAAASIPLALHHGVTTGRLGVGHRVVTPAFGAGATWGAAALVWPDVKVLPG
ncbi:beta-ketoacyl-ACP synthase III [Micromonospora polyrhachis]|uniref:Beta-ketoacyl-[acyl-carrier-protein] synthase III n=1 Tax=Micromonospora polyrhachis TaxID=1282883 RepID=A0A7W7SU44_9ACTN|nr:beta-ketoacyl-ACP synthase 3 [Micromonospora polyrhachis]MBB4961030.1 3-oxoacyl-[acyl-carrier-protein] synthase-3 [Micromonospora polyrhachis]